MRPYLLIFSFTALLGFATCRHAQKRQAATNYEKWPNATLNYSFSRSLPMEFQVMFRDAFRFISSKTCIKFHHDPNGKEKFSVRIRQDRKGGECFSYYGMYEREQKLTVDYDCASFGTAVHELMHALGIFHEQARSDRDKYLIVDSTNHNYNLEPTSYNPVPFDYGSVMLYPKSESVIPKDPEYNFTMGNPRVSFYDMMLLNKYYDCNCDGQKERLDCQNGGYQNPARCDRCICTDGFHGHLCEKLHSDYQFEATKDWQTASFRNNNMRGSPEDTTVPERFFYISSPPNTKIQVQLTKLSGFFCHDACDYNGVEVKCKEDRRIVSPMVCCDNDSLWNTTRTSSHNPTVIVMYGEDRGPEFSWKYRYVAGEK